MRAQIITDKEQFIEFIDKAEVPLRIVNRKVYAGDELIAVLAI